MPDDETSRRTRAMIYTRSDNNVIGQNGGVPWKYPGERRRFDRVTAGCAVVMGRRAFESWGSVLAGRRNIVWSHRPIPPRTEVGAIDASSITRVGSMEEAMLAASGLPVWFIGGALLYAAALRFVDLIDETIVPVTIPVEGSEAIGTVLAPRIDPDVFDAGDIIEHEDDPTLRRRIYRRK